MGRLAGFAMIFSLLIGQSAASLAQDANDDSSLSEDDLGALDERGRSPQRTVDPDSTDSGTSEQTPAGAREPEPFLGMSADAPPLELGATLSIISNARDATVRVDGQDVGRIPVADLALDAGEHQLEITAPSYRRVQAPFSLSPGQERTLTVLLRREAPVSRESVPRDLESPAASTEAPDGFGFFPSQERTSLGIALGGSPARGQTAEEALELSATVTASLGPILLRPYIGLTGRTSRDAAPLWGADIGLRIYQHESELLDISVGFSFAATAFVTTRTTVDADLGFYVSNDLRLGQVVVTVLYRHGLLTAELMEHVLAATVGVVL